jgi:hypothetical protein
VGLFKKLQSLAGGVSSELMNNGLLGRGQVTDVKQTKVSTGPEGAENPVCVFTVQVMLDNVPPYEATCRQAVPMMVVPQLASGAAVVAVRVNPNNQQEIALDLNTEPPVVAMSAQPGQETAADILTKGKPARAVIVQSEPLGMKSPKGLDMYAFQLTIMVEGKAPYQIKVGNPVTPGGVPLVFPGSNLPAKYMPDAQPESVAIDWDAAVAEATNKKS